MTATPLRLLILTQYFPPETGAPQARLSEMALLLKEKGVEVEILTAMPNYPAGKIYAGYRGKWFCRDTWQGLSVIRAFIYPTKNPGLLPRLLNYFSFVFSSLAAGLFMTRRPHVILVESPPLFLGISGWILKTVRRAKLVFNVSDLWPETAIALGLYARGSGFVKIATGLERFLYRNAAACTGQSFGIARGIFEKYPRARVSLIPNGADCKKFSPARRNRAVLEKWAAGGKTVVGYAGLIGIAQGIRLLIDAAKLLEDDKDVVFLIAGDGPEQDALEKEAGPNVVFTGLLRKEDMPEMVASFDMTVIPLRAHIPGALPSKMYEAMASGVPVILAASGDPKELLDRAQAGIALRYDDPASVAEAVRRLKASPDLRETLGKNGRDYVLAHHQRAQIAEKLHRTLVSALGNDDAFFDNEKKSVFPP